ncbi:MAG: AraC family transcriptional regulator ligand-binding domain-containing protein [Bermanella sp.]
MSRKRSINGLIPLINLLESHGHDPLPLLTKHHVDLDTMVGSAVIELEVELEIVADIVERLDDPLLGLEVGSQINFTSYGALALLIMTAPTLLEACRLTIQFQSLALLFSQVTMEQEKDWIELRYSLPEGDATIKNFIADRDLMGVYVFIREILSPAKRCLLSYGTARPKPTGALLKRYSQYIDFKPVFDQPYNWFRIPISIAREKMPHTNPLVHKVHLIQAYELLRNLFPDNKDTVAQVRQVVAGYKNQFPTLPDLAKTLRTSERTLRRKLKDSGISYREILDEHKKKRALEMLASKDMSISELTESLGYTESTSFLRAFKRWTGKAPKQYKKDQQEK